MFKIIEKLLGTVKKKPYYLCLTPTDYNTFLIVISGIGTLKSLTPPISQGSVCTGRHGNHVIYKGQSRDVGRWTLEFDMWGLV